jgi:hypothetical protein
LIPVFAQAFAAAKQFNRCPAAAWSPACRSGPCNCLSAARPSIFCLNALFRSAPWKSGLFRALWQYVTALARWLVIARRLRAKPLPRAHVCADRAGWLKRLRRTLRFLLPISGKAIVLDFAQPRLIHSTLRTSSLPSMSPRVVLGICHHEIFDRARPLAESNSPPACGPTGYFNGMGPDQNSAGR